MKISLQSTEPSSIDGFIIMKEETEIWTLDTLSTNGMVQSFHDIIKICAHKGWEQRWTET